MAKFEDVRTLQMFGTAHASIHNHFSQNRHLNRRNIFKQNRAAALGEWRQLVARDPHLTAFWRLVRFGLTAPLGAKPHILLKK